MNGKTLIALSSVAFSMFAFGGVLDAAWLKGTTDKDPLAYGKGEEIVFTVTPEELDGAVPEGAYFLNHDLLTAALDQQGKWAGAHVETSDAWVSEELKKVIASLDWTKAREDVAAFVHAGDLQTLEFFEPGYFASLADRIGR